jgi:hypothetical protein
MEFKNDKIEFESYLQELLYEIKINENIYFIPKLLKNKEVEEIVFGLCRRYKVRKMIVDKILQDYVVREYVYSDIFTVERFKNEVVKWVGRKVFEKNGRERRNGR